MVLATPEKESRASSPSFPLNHLRSNALKHVSARVEILKIESYAGSDSDSNGSFHSSTRSMIQPSVVGNKSCQSSCRVPEISGKLVTECIAMNQGSYRKTGSIHLLLRLKFQFQFHIDHDFTVSNSIYTNSSSCA